MTVCVMCTQYRVGSRCYIMLGCIFINISSFLCVLKQNRYCQKMVVFITKQRRNNTLTLIFDRVSVLDGGNSSLLNNKYLI